MTNQDNKPVSLPSKSKWFGKCNICDEDTKLSTIHITMDCGINYWIKRACDDCIESVRHGIYWAIDFRNPKTYSIRNE